MSELSAARCNADHDPTTPHEPLRRESPSGELQLTELGLTPRTTVAATQTVSGAGTPARTGPISLRTWSGVNGKQTPLVQPGQTANLVVTFKKNGKYPYLCTVPGHAEAAMKGVFTVR